MRRTTLNTVLFAVALSATGASAGYSAAAEETASPPAPAATESAAPASESKSYLPPWMQQQAGKPEGTAATASPADGSKPTQSADADAAKLKAAPVNAKPHRRRHRDGFRGFVDLFGE